MPTFQVSASSDDFTAVWNDTNSTWGGSLTDIEFVAGNYNWSYMKRGGAARFLNVTIPNGATIDSAYLTFRCRNSRSSGVVRTKIAGELAPNPITFSTLADYQARTTTDQVPPHTLVYWDNIGAWVLDTDYNSPEIKTIIQQLVNQAGWVSGNAMVLFWDDHDDRSDGGNYAVREAYTYNGSATYAPKLVVTYTSFTPKIFIV